MNNIGNIEGIRDPQGENPQLNNLGQYGYPIEGYEPEAIEQRIARLLPQVPNIVDPRALQGIGEAANIVPQAPDNEVNSRSILLAIVGVFSGILLIISGLGLIVSGHGWDVGFSTMGSGVLLLTGSAITLKKLFARLPNNQPEEDRMIEENNRLLNPQVFNPVLREGHWLAEEDPRVREVARPNDPPEGQIGQNA